MSTTVDPIDHEALERRYAEERDKRLRPDGPDQYVEPTGRYAHFVDDPYIEPVEREPKRDHVTVAIIGAGFAGLAAGARLREAGIDDIRLIETGGDVGGAWYWNRYPGAMCDTASMIYLPLLEETGHVPSHKYTAAPENFAHAQRIAEQYGLYDDALFSTKVTDLRWEEEHGRWRIATDRGDEFSATYVSMGVGPLNKPKLPGIEGIEDFEGHAFHTSRWDYAYTGGDWQGAPMEGLADKRVGIIGTGATAVQCIPHLARDAGDLYVFQRTPSAVDARNNHPIDADWFATLEPGWQRRWLENFCTLYTGGFAEEDLVQDGWTDITRRIRDRVVAMVSEGAPLDEDTLARAARLGDDDKMTEIRARIDEIVDDPATAEALKPWYRQWCKRPCFHDTYLQAYNEPGCHLVDTDGQGVERIDATGVWVAGRHYELDCLIFASGFEFATDFTHRCGYETTGRDGRTLADHWEKGMRTLHGLQVHGFPNLFISGISQNASLISNVTSNLTDAADTIAAVVGHAHQLGDATVEPTAEAEQGWVDRIAGGGRRGPFANPDCTPGYYNNEGRPEDLRARMGGGDPDGPLAFFAHIAAWRTSGDFEGLTFT